MTHTFARVIVVWVIGTGLLACTSGRSIEGNVNSRAPLIKAVDVPDKNKAVLYIYRPYRFGSALAAPHIFINNKKIIALSNQSHTWLSIDAGDYVIETRLNSNWSSGDQDAYQLKAESGQIYFLRVRAETTFNPILLLIGSPVGTNFPLVQVKDSEALAELNETLYLEPEIKNLP